MIRRVSTLDFARAHADAIGAGAAAALELPMVPDILDTIDAHRGARFFILAAYQTFKSLLGQLRIVRSMLIEPQPAIWYATSEQFAAEFADTKFNPLFDSLGPLQRLLPHDRARRAKLRYSLADGASRNSLLILSAKTENARHGKTACDIYLDEVHLYESGWIAQIRNRHGAFPYDFREVLMSTGLTAGTEAANEWATTDQRVWHVRCPACSRLFEPRYLHRDPITLEITGGLRYTRATLESGLPDSTAIAASLAYECPHCHARLPDTAASRVALSGTAADPRGLYVSANSSPSASAFGWQVSGLALRPWLPVVLRFETAHAARTRGDLEPLANCIREEFAGLWTPDDYFREHRQRPAGDYSMGADWSGEARDRHGRPWRFGTVDVQQDHYVLVIRSWSSDSASRLRHAEKITTAGILSDRLAAHAVMPERTFLDCRHEPERVKRLAGLQGWRVLEGEPEKSYPHKALGNIRRIFSEPQPLDPWLGTVHAGRTAVLLIRFSKPSALDRLHLLRHFDRNDGTLHWSAPADSPEWYWREIDAHHRVPKSGANGDKYYEWTTHGPDHAADAEAMQIVAASMAGLVGAESLESDTPTALTDPKGKAKP
jgi:hypothetical protein